ncbi:MAG: glycosyltransferase family 39 protein [Polyangiaceae bacterium]|nr:glycosyltransferase family 39 protein [Polyangiaceae bacterium]
MSAASPAHEKPPSAPAIASPISSLRARKNVDTLVGLGLAGGYVTWLLATARSLGFSRDEGFYFTAARDYERWFVLLLDSPRKAMERSAIDAIWQNNHEHPSLMKSLFAISHWLFFNKWKVFADESTAFRLPGMLMMGLAIYVTYIFSARHFSRRAGLVSALALGLMPRVFYHAHLACFDVPIMAMWISCVYAYWRAEGGGNRLGSTHAARGSLGWAVLAGLVFGLALETKHNAWMLPAVFVPHAVFVLGVHGRAMVQSLAKTSRIVAPASLVSMAILGPLIFLLLWPWMWNDTIARLIEYVNFHIHHEYYNIEFLGRTYFGPPSPKAYMPVMILATVPTATIVLFLIGAVDRVRILVMRVMRAASSLAGGRDRAETDVLILLALAVPLMPFLLPHTPIFGGTKHWMPAYPFLAILAGRGFDIVWSQLDACVLSRMPLHGNKARVARVSEVTAIALTFSGALAVTVHSHPFGLSTYVPFFGGTAGGADLGLNRQFWGFTTQSLDPYFQKNTKSGDTVYIMDTAWPSWARLVEEKRVPPWLRGVSSPAEATFSIVHHEQHMNEVDYNIWTEYRSSTPHTVLTHDGVPIITVYKKSPNHR